MLYSALEQLQKAELHHSASHKNMGIKSYWWGGTFFLATLKDNCIIQKNKKDMQHTQNGKMAKKLKLRSESLGVKLRSNHGRIRLVISTADN